MYRKVLFLPENVSFDPLRLYFSWLMIEMLPSDAHERYIFTSVLHCQGQFIFLSFRFI